MYMRMVMSVSLSYMLLGKTLLVMNTLGISKSRRLTTDVGSERWLPIHTVESIVLSVISMLSDPNDESPANIEAAKEWR